MKLDIRPQGLEDADKTLSFRVAVTLAERGDRSRAPVVHGTTVRYYDNIPSSHRPFAALRPTPSTTPNKVGK